jgi:hypothetical protein
MRMNRLEVICLQRILNFYVISEMNPVGCSSFGANMGKNYAQKITGYKEFPRIRKLLKTLKKFRKS